MANLERASAVPDVVHGLFVKALQPSQHLEPACTNPLLALTRRYVLNASGPVFDLDPLGIPEFEVVSTVGKRHVLRASSVPVMMQWVRKIRQTIQSPDRLNNSGSHEQSPLNRTANSMANVLDEALTATTTVSVSLMFLPETNSHLSAGPCILVSLQLLKS